MKANITNHFIRLSKPIALAMFLIISSIVNAQSPTPAAMFQGNHTYWVNGVGLDHVLPKDTFADLTGAHLQDSVFIQTTGLLTAFNNQGVDPATLGQVTFILAPGYTGNEGNVINIGRPLLTGSGGYPWMNSTRPVVIKPAPGSSFVITTTAVPMAANSALVRFNGAQYVTIDGEGTAGQKNITFKAPTDISNPSGIRVVDIKAFAATGCRFLTVKNCRIVGSSTAAINNTYAGIYSGSSTASPGAPVLTSQNITITGNIIEAVQNGIYMRGVETIANRQDNALTVSNNIIGGTIFDGVANTTYVGGANAAGITLIAQKNAVVSGNTIRNNIPTQGNFRGIQLASPQSTLSMDSNITINGNKIYNLRSTGSVAGVYGIRLTFLIGTHTQSLAITVSNNTIGNLMSSLSGTLISGQSNIVGMMVEDQSSNVGLNVYNNSVNLYGDTVNVSGISACFLTSTGVTGGIRMSNNIFVNRLGRTLSTTGLSPYSYIYAIGAPSSPFLSISNNAYYVNNTSGAFSFLGIVGTSNKSTLKTWSAATNDNSSISNIAPFVLSGNNDTCFIAGTAASILGTFGTPVGISTDISGNTRSATTPSVGAYEFAGNASIANYALKGGSSYTINGTSSWPVGNGATTTGSFATLADAITYVNTYGVAGTGTVRIRFAPGYTGETTFIPHLLNYNGASASRPLLIDVTPGSSFTVSAPASAAVSTQYAVLNMIAAKFVTINGSSVAGQRNLTFAVPSTYNTTNINVIGLTTLDSDSISDISISNCNVIGASSTTAIFTASGIYHGGYNPTAGVVSANIGNSKNLTIVNNYVSAVRSGIYIRGANTLNGHTRNVTISRNLIGGTIPQGTASNVTYIGGAVNQAGIMLKGVAIATVDSNIIRNCDSVGSVSLGFRGIDLDIPNGEINAVDTAINITRNTIYNLTTAGGSYCAGIRIGLGSANTRTITVINNSIAKIRGIGASQNGATTNPAGILVDGAGTVTNLGLTMFHNTVNLNGTSLTGSNSSACVFIASSIQGGVRFENNLLTNRLGRVGAASGRAYAVYIGATSAATIPFNFSSGGFVNGNAYGADAPNTSENYVMGAGTNNYVFVKQWQTYSNQDVTSFAYNGFFVNDSTPFLDPRFSGLPYNSILTKVTVTTDIAGNARNVGGLTCVGALQFAQDYLPLAGNQTYDINGTNKFPRTSVAGPYSFATITDAVNYLNTNGVDGISTDTRRVVLKLSAGYPGEPVDTFIPVIRAYPRMNASRIVTITTSAGRSDTIRTNTTQLYPANGSVLRFLGASNFEIDGDNGSGGRGITIALPNVVNVNAGTLKLVDITSGDNAITNVQIRNCNLIGTSSGTTSISTFAAIYMGGVNATPAQPLIAGNSNHVFENNFIVAVKYGIYAQGVTAAFGSQDKGTIIKRNVIGSAATYAGNSLNWGGANNAAGIFLSAQANVLVDSNVISNNMNSFANNRAIELFSANLAGSFSVDSGITISRNTITGISNLTPAGGAYGIYMSFADSTTPRNDRGFVIKNNMISNITAPGTAPSPATSFNSNANPFGIYVEGIYPGARGEISGFGLRIWSNSINLGYNTSMLTGAFSACIGFSSQVKGGVIFQNNILQNRLGRASGTGTAASVLVGHTGTIFTLSDNNIYYSNAPGSTNIIGASSTTLAAPVVYATIPQMQVFSRQDTMSLNFITNFTSETNLLLAVGAPHMAYDWGAIVPSVTNDIEGNPRSAFARPTIGADQIVSTVVVDSIAPRVYDVTKPPLFCNAGAITPVTFRVFERATAIAADTLYYSINGAAELKIIGATSANGFSRTYNIPLPTPSENLSIAYRLVVVDNSSSAFRTAYPTSGYNYTSTSFTTFPLTYGFDLPNVGGWTVDNNVNGVPSLGGWDINAFGSPINPTVLPQTGLKAAVFPAASLADGSVSRLISPCLDFTNMKVPTLRMWVSQNAEVPAKNDVVQVLVGYGLLTWSAPLATVYRVNPNSVFPEFVQVDVCLSNFAGISGYRIAIEGISKNGQNMVLDSVVIFDDVLNRQITPLTSTICAYNNLALNIDSSSNIYRYSLVDTRNGLPLGPAVLGNANKSALSIIAPNPSNPAIARIDSVRAIVSYTNTLSGCIWQMPDTATINIKNFYGGPFMTQGTPFSGVYSTGTFAKPDGAKMGDTLTYAIAAPSGLTNADYGTKWTIVNPFVATPIEGRPLSNVSFTAATPSTGAFITAKPTAPDLDSTFKVSATIRFMPSGCDSTVVRYVKVSSSPTASFTNASDSVCSGAAIYFTNTSTAQANTYPITYHWTFGDGTTASTGDANKIYAFDKAPGIYTVTLRATNSAGVFHTVSKQITVLPAPLTTYTSGLACGTDPIAFTNTTASAVSYLWTVRLNNQVKDTSTLTNPTFSFAIPDTAYSVTLRATNNLGCSRDSIRGVFAFAKPVAAFSTIDQCAGKNATFVNTSTITSGGSNRVNTFGSFWDFGNGDIGLSNSPIYKYPTNGTYTVKLKVTSNYGCMDSTTRTVNIYEKPVAGFTTGIACETDTLVITNTTSFTGGLNKVLYAWDFGDFSPISNDANPIKTYGVVGPFTIQLITHDTIHNCYDTATKQIQVNEVPEYVGFAANDGCKGTPVEFSNASIPPIGQTLTYAWTFGDGGTSIATNPSHPYATAGDFRITLRSTTNKGCYDDAVDTITIDNVPDAGFTWDSINCSTVEFTPNTKGLSNYFWDFGDGSKQNTGDGTVPNIYQTKGLHTVILKVTSSNGCSNSDTNTIVETFCTVGFEELFISKFNLSVYPNPFEDVANISYNLDSKQNVSVTVMDILGRKVSEVVENNQTAGNHIIRLTESKFAAAGVYMVRIQIGDESITKQLIRK